MLLSLSLALSLKTIYCLFTNYTFNRISSISWVAMKYTINVCEHCNCINCGARKYSACWKVVSANERKRYESLLNVRSIPIEIRFLNLMVDNEFLCSMHGLIWNNFHHTFTRPIVEKLTINVNPDSISKFVTFQKLVSNSRDWRTYDGFPFLRGMQQFATKIIGLWRFICI